VGTHETATWISLTYLSVFLVAFVLLALMSMKRRLIQ
jgi:hypothetical protein